MKSRKKTVADKNAHKEHRDLIEYEKQQEGEGGKQSICIEQLLDHRMWYQENNATLDFQRGTPVRRRKRGRPASALLLLLAPFFLSLAASSKSSSSVTRRAWVGSVRGGDDDDSNQYNEKNKRFVSSQSLHRFNQDVMAGVQSFEQDRAERRIEESNKKSEKKRGKQQEKVDRIQNGRGGAVAVKTTTPNKPASPRNGIFGWLGPSLPAESKGRDGAEEETEENNQIRKAEEQVEMNTVNSTATSSEGVGGADLAKLWWVNVWTQQLPDRPNKTLEENTTTISNASTEDEDISSSKKSRNDSNGPKKSSKGNSASLKDESKLQRVKELESESTAKRSKKSMSQEEVAIEKDEVPTGETIKPEVPEKNYVSTGYWIAIDGLTSLGLSAIHPAFRISRPLRPIRKATARITGLHGALSGKPRKVSPEVQIFEEKELGDEDLAMVRRRLAAIDKARVGVEKIAKTDELEATKKRNRWWGREEPVEVPEVKQIATVAAEMTIPSIRKTPEELQEEKRRKERVQEIDRLMSQAQKQLMQLACEKDELQRRPNPLWNYTTETVSRKKGNQTTITTRQFNFPPEDLVNEYLDFLLSSGRLVKMNHTDLWQNDLEEDEDESIGDDIASMSALDDRRQRSNGNRGGNWILRQSLGKGSTLGEKIGEAAEQAAYKSIARAVMAALSRSISAIHGVNIMTHTDIRLSMEATPDLPPMSKQGIIPGGRNPNYARDALQDAMRRGARKNRAKRYRYDLSEDAFVQRDAVVETLISHCQIAAPLLKLFPLAWQRAMLGNILTLVTAVIADFCEGVQFEILGHRLSFSFTPITENDMINHIAMAGPSFNRQNLRSEQFEAAVQATANDLSENLKFLDRWHERLLGSGVLRSQIANLIARLVLTLAGEVLSGAQMDLWASQAGGPRMVAGLEFRTTSNYMEEIPNV